MLPGTDLLKDVKATTPRDPKGQDTTLFRGPFSRRPPGLRYVFGRLQRCIRGWTIGNLGRSTAVMIYSVSPVPFMYAGDLIHMICDDTVLYYELL